MSTIKRVTIEFEDYTIYIENEVADRWNENGNGNACFAQVHGCNLFEKHPIEWNKISNVDTKKRESKLLCTFDNFCVSKENGMCTLVHLRCKYQRQT